MAGQVLTAAQADDWAQGGVANATPLTSAVGPTSGTTELDVITAPAVTIAATNRRLRITFHCRGLSGGTVGDQFTLRIKEGATTLGESVQIIQSSGTHLGGDFSAVVDAPSAASHTYKTTIQRASGTGTVSVSALAGGPITLVVEDIGTV